MDDIKVKKTTTKSEKQNKTSGNKLLLAGLAFVAVVAIGAAGFFWNEAQDAKGTTPEAVAERNQEESARVIGSLDEILLTESEGAPTVARVEDPEVLRQANEDFYKNAAEGDYLVLYPQRAILYRELEAKIINVAPIINTDQLRANTGGTTPANGSAGAAATPESTEADSSQ